MVFCPYCGSENLARARYCQSCGERIDELLARARTLAQGDAQALVGSGGDDPEVEAAPFEAPPPVPPLVVDTTRFEGMSVTGDDGARELEEAAGGEEAPRGDGDQFDELDDSSGADRALFRDGDGDGDDLADGDPAEGDEDAGDPRSAADHGGDPGDDDEDGDHAGGEAQQDGALGEDLHDETLDPGAIPHEDEWVPDESFIERLRSSGRRRVAVAIGGTLAVGLAAGLFALTRHGPAPSPPPAALVATATPDLAQPPAPAEVVADAVDAAPAALAAAPPGPAPAPPAPPVPPVPPRPTARRVAEPAASPRRSGAGKDEAPAAAEPRAPAPSRPRGPTVERSEPPARASRAADSDPGARRPFTSRGAASAAVRTVAREHDDEGYDCFVSAFPSAGPGTRARVTVRFVLGIEGKASEVNVTSNSAGNEELASCLVSRVYGWTFPPSAVGDVPVSHTFSFTSR